MLRGQLGRRLGCRALRACQRATLSLSGLGFGGLNRALEAELRPSSGTFFFALRLSSLVVRSRFLFGGGVLSATTTLAH